jgi:hypothetical protein
VSLGPISSSPPDLISRQIQSAPDPRPRLAQGYCRRRFATGRGPETVSDNTWRRLSSISVSRRAASFGLRPSSGIFDASRSSRRRADLGDSSRRNPSASVGLPRSCCLVVAAAFSAVLLFLCRSSHQPACCRRHAAVAQALADREPLVAMLEQYWTIPGLTETGFCAICEEL